MCENFFSHASSNPRVYIHICISLSLYIFVYIYTLVNVCTFHCVYPDLVALFLSEAQPFGGKRSISFPTYIYIYFCSFSDVLRDSLVLLLLLLLLGFGSRIFGWIIVLKCKFALNGVREDVIVNFLTFDSSLDFENSFGVRDFFCSFP